MPDDYPTIQQAVNHALEGDNIFVRNGIYSESITINKNLILEGEDKKSTIIEGMGNNVIYIDNAEVLIKRFTIRNGSYGIYTYGSVLNVSNAIIRNNGKDGIYHDGSYTNYPYPKLVRPKKLTLRDSTIENNGGSGVRYWYFSQPGHYYVAIGDSIIEGNLIRNNNGNGLYIRLDSSYVSIIRDNLIINNTGDGVYSEAGEAVIENNTIEEVGKEGLYISASNVKLANISINSTGDNGLHLDSVKNMTFDPPLIIQNVTSYGIYTYGSVLNVSNAIIRNNGKDGIYHDGSYTNYPYPKLVRPKKLTLRDSTIENNGGSGVRYWYFSQPGHYYVAIGDSIIEGNLIRNNNGNGLYIRLDSSYVSIIRDNLIINNTGDGVYSEAGEAVIENNTIEEVGKEGLYISASNVKLANISINSTGDNGLHLDSVKNMTFDPPLIIQNVNSYGIYTYGSVLNVSNAIIKNCKKDGIYHGGSFIAYPYKLVRPQELTLRDSIIENNGGSGVRYWYFSQFGHYYVGIGNSTIEGNIIRNNNGSGLYIRLASPFASTVRNNLIINNTGYGVYSEAGTAIIENNTIEDVGKEGFYLSASNVILANISINSTGDNGLHLDSVKNMTFHPPLIIQNVTNYGIYTYGSVLNVSNAIIKNCKKDGIYHGGSFIAYPYKLVRPQELTLRDSIIENNGGSGVRYWYFSQFGHYYVGIGNSTIEGNIIRNNNGSGLYIRLASPFASTVRNNLIINNTGYGVYSEAGTAVIENNTIENGTYDGIKLDIITLHSLIKNRVLNSSGFGIDINISSSSKNPGIIRSNILANNYYGFSIAGTSVNSYYQDIDTSNIIDGKPIYYLIEKNNTIYDNISASYLGFISSKNITVTNYLDLIKNGQGILIVNTSHSEIINNNILHNEQGIYLFNSNYNMINDNHVTLNEINGISIENSNNNQIFNNYISTNGNSIWMKESNYNVLFNNMIFGSGNGIYLSNCRFNDEPINNIIKENIIYNNSKYGIYLYRSNNTQIFRNNLDNINQAYNQLISQDNPNLWDNGPEDGGNYWSDHQCLGNPSNGSTPYYIPGTIINWNGLEPKEDYSVDRYPYQYPIDFYLDNKPPIAIFIYSPEDPVVTQTVTFDASSSYDLDGNILSYIWDFGDGNITSTINPTITHSYLSAGDFSVNLTLNDNLGVSNSSIQNIQVKFLTFYIDLYSGWNLISTPLLPDDNNIATILSSISGNYSIVWAYNASDTADHWKKYDPSTPFGNDLITMEPGKGYWIMMNSDDTLNVSGTILKPTDIELWNGWNLIGYNSLNPQTITDALSSINGNYSIIWAYNAGDLTDQWKKYDPDTPFGNDLANMEPGKGYWIMMTTDDILEI